MCPPHPFLAMLLGRGGQCYPRFTAVTSLNGPLALHGAGAGLGGWGGGCWLQVCHPSPRP